MKKVEWIITHNGGEDLFPGDPFETREEARRLVKTIKKDIFENWWGHVCLPLVIKRREWVVVDEKVVR